MNLILMLNLLLVPPTCKLKSENMKPIVEVLCENNLTCVQQIVKVVCK